MKRSLVLSAICFSIIAISSNVFAAFKACGQIQQSVGTLTFVQQLKDGESVTSSIYGKTPEITKELSLLVGFREVCVLATSNESDIVVTKVISRDE